MTNRERKLLGINRRGELVERRCSGMNMKAAAAAMGISPKTAEYHWTEILKRFEAGDAVQVGFKAGSNSNWRRFCGS